jgi:hypothetical protein
MEQIFANFQKYDERGRRINIFAVEDDFVVGHLKIVYFPCSNRDQFSKNKGWELYNNYRSFVDLSEGLHRSSEVIPLVTVLFVEIDDNKPKKTFLNWCNDNFYQKRDTVERRNHEIEYLINKEKNIIIIKDSPRLNKFTMNNK